MEITVSELSNQSLKIILCRTKQNCIEKVTASLKAHVCLSSFTALLLCLLRQHIITVWALFEVSHVQGATVLVEQMLVTAGCPLNPQNKVRFINSLPLWVSVLTDAFLNRQAVIRGLLAALKYPGNARHGLEPKSTGVGHRSDYFVCS